MDTETVYKITVSSKEIETIKDLLDVLDNCPIDLSNAEYMEIIRSIANESRDVDIDGIQLSFEDDINLSDLEHIKEYREKEQNKEDSLNNTFSY